MKLRTRKTRKQRFNKKTKNTRKQRINKKTRKNKGGMLRSSIQKSLKNIANKSKGLGKDLLSVGEDVVTEVSKEQLKQLPKNASNAYYITQKNTKQNLNNFNIDDETKQNTFDFKYTPTIKDTNTNNIDFENMSSIEQTPLKNIKNEDLQIDTPVKEEYIRQGSVLLHKADITQVKKNLFEDD